MARILVVDDDPGIRELLATVLALAEHQVVGAGCGSEALDRLGVEQFDLVLLDIWLPDLSGYDLLELLRTKPECTETPVIIISGSSDQEGALRGARAGVLDHVPKPFDPDTLLAVVSRALAAPSGMRFVREMRARSADVYSTMLTLCESARTTPL